MSGAKKATNSIGGVQTTCVVVRVVLGRKRGWGIFVSPAESRAAFR